VELESEGRWVQSVSAQMACAKSDGGFFIFRPDCAGVALRMMAK
jgi:hypothetical protein